MLRSSRLLDSILDLLGPFWHMAENSLEGPRAVQEHLFSILEPSRSAPRGFQERSKMPSGGQEAPRGLHGAILDKFGVHLGRIRASFRTLFIWDSLLVRKGWLLCQTAAGMLSARWPVSGAQPLVRSGHRAYRREAGCSR